MFKAEHKLQGWILEDTNDVCFWHTLIFIWLTLTICTYYKLFANFSLNVSPGKYNKNTNLLEHFYKDNGLRNIPFISQISLTILKINLRELYFNLQFSNFIIIIFHLHGNFLFNIPQQNKTDSITVQYNYSKLITTRQT